MDGQISSINLRGLGCKERAIDPLMREPSLEIGQPGAMEVGRIGRTERKERITLQGSHGRTDKLQSGVGQAKKRTHRREALN
eukprot:scaffold863_cov100-Cylindrotheca_fusiformis.AAC.2